MIKFLHNCVEGEVPPQKVLSESAWPVKMRKNCERMVAPELSFLIRSREDRVSPLQRLSARTSGKSGGTADVFALSFIGSGLFFMLQWMVI